jgi:hypothetical protein
MPIYKKRITTAFLPVFRFNLDAKNQEKVKQLLLSTRAFMAPELACHSTLVEYSLSD